MNTVAARAGKFFYRWGLLLTLVLLVAVFSLASANFLTGSNLVNILRSISIVTVIAVGVSVSLAVGGFDLSVGSIASAADAVVMAAFVWWGWSLPAALALTAITALVLGALNAFLIVRFRVPDMLVTLATMFILQGAAMTFTQGGSITQNMPLSDGSTALGKVDPGFLFLGQVPWIIVVMLVVVVVVQLFLSFTKPGRALYAVGGNPEAARLSGLRVGGYKLLAYLVSALLAALGGILLASRIGSSQVNGGSAYLMDAVAAAYIGSTFAGMGKPNAAGAFVGAAVLGILQNGLVMLSVPYYSMDIVKGAVLAFALGISYMRRR